MKRLRARYGCPVELTLEFVGGKWKAVILAWLKQAPMRYGELRARMPDVTDKVLTERLKDLETLGLVEKAMQDDRPVYRLTARGDGLRPILDALYAWGEVMAAELPVTVATGNAPCGEEPAPILPPARRRRSSPACRRDSAR